MDTKSYKLKEEQYDRFLANCSDAEFDAEMEKATALLLKVFKLKAERDFRKDIT